MKKLVLLIVGFLVIVFIGAAWFVNGLSPVGSDKTEKRFVVNEGETANGIGIGLAKNHIIKSALAFRIYSQVTQSAKKIKPGSYELTANLWIPQIITKLLAGPTEVWVTVPEGLRREEIAQKFVDGFELTGTAAETFYNQFLSLTVNKEGYLFPDTYLFARDTKATSVVKFLEDNFDKRYASLSVSNSALTKTQVVTLASIVQREAITPEDMQGVASVLMNRYNEGMPFGSDVTLEYALGKQPDGNWWKEGLTVDDLALNSAYNTRLVAGFPPTPISNPGLVALEAAANPQKSDYLYYLSDSDGKLHFAKTLEEHNANIAKYLQ